MTTFQAITSPSVPNQLLHRAPSARPLVSFITTPMIRPIAFSLPALICSAASGCAAIAASTISASSPRPTSPPGLALDDRRGRALGDEDREHLLGGAAVDGLGLDEADQSGERLGRHLRRRRSRRPPREVPQSDRR